jgi:hypothetical protein
MTVHNRLENDNVNMVEIENGTLRFFIVVIVLLCMSVWCMALVGVCACMMYYLFLVTVAGRPLRLQQSQQWICQSISSCCAFPTLSVAVNHNMQQQQE